MRQDFISAESGTFSSLHFVIWRKVFLLCGERFCLRPVRCQCVDIEPYENAVVREDKKAEPLIFSLIKLPEQQQYQT